MSEVVEKPVISEVVKSIAPPVGLLGQLQALVISQKRNLQNLSVLVFINVLVAGVGFITKVKIANTLGKADFGLFSYGFAIASYGMVIIQFGLDRTFVRDLIHYPEKRGQLVAASLVLKGFLFLLVTMTLLVWKYFSTPDSDLTWGVLLVALGNSMLGLELKSLYDAMGQFNRHAVYNLVQRCMYFLAVWLMILVFPRHTSIYWLGTFTVVSVGLYLYIQCRWALARIDFSGVFENIMSKTLRLASDNLIIWFSAIGALTIATLNQILLKIYHGKESLGLYSAAWQIASVAMLFLMQIARIGNPAMARITRPDVSKVEKKRLLVKYSGVMFLSVLPVCAVLFFSPEYIVKFLYKPEYLSSAGVLRFMGVYMLMYSLGLVFSQYVISARKDTLYLISIFIGGGISVVLCFTLIPVYKDYGAILALLLSHLFSIVFHGYVIVKDLCIQRNSNR